MYGTQEIEYCLQFRRLPNTTHCEVKWKLSTLSLPRSSFIRFEKKKNHCGNRTQTGDIIYKWTCLCAVTANECNLFRRYYIKIYITSSLCFHFCTLPLLFCVLICLSNFRAFYFIVFRDELRTRHSGLTTFVDNHATVSVYVLVLVLVLPQMRYSLPATIKFIFSRTYTFVSYIMYSVIAVLFIYTTLL